jgi:hypothetical protein
MKHRYQWWPFIGIWIGSFLVGCGAFSLLPDWVRLVDVMLGVFGVAVGILAAIEEMFNNLKEALEESGHE